MGKKRKGNRLFAKYFVVITAVILLSVFVICSSYIVIATRYWTSEQKNSLQHNAQIVADNSHDILNRFSSVGNNSGGDPVDISPLMVICNTLNQLSNAINADIFIVNTNGTVVFCKETLDKEFEFAQYSECRIHKNMNIPYSIMKEAVKDDYSSVSTLDGLFKKNQITASSPIVVDGHTVAVVFATEPIAASWYTYVLNTLKIFFMSALIAFVFSFLTVYFLSYKLTKPLKQMSIATKLYSQGDFSYKVDVKGKDELSELAEAFNSMAMSLSALESSRRSFVANVSHELKTPMTSIGGFIDGILDGTIPQNEHKYYLGLVSDEVKRLSRLVTGMLNMSKLEDGKMPINYTSFDIGSDIFKTLLSFERKIEAKELEILGLDKMESITVRADEDLMMQVIYNLVDNAVKFTPKNGYIEISMRTDNKFAYVTIKNSGSGIERDELGKVFERFYKIDRSRSYDVKGAGLGLYLVKSIVELHSGQITVDSKVGEYTEFTFSVPLN